MGKGQLISKAKEKSEVITIDNVCGENLHCEENCFKIVAVSIF